MPKKKRKTYGTFVALWDPDFDAVRAAMEIIEEDIEKNKEEIDPGTVMTRVRCGPGPFDVSLSWMAKERG